MLTTANTEIDQKFRLWRQHGMSVPDTVRHSSPQVVFESYPVMGFNYRMTDIQAAIGREQLKRIPDAVIGSPRESGPLPGTAVGCPRLDTSHRNPTGRDSNWQSYCVRLSAELDQRTVMQHMLDEGIATRRGIMCAHLEPAYAGANRGVRHRGMQESGVPQPEGKRTCAEGGNHSAAFSRR